MRSPAKKAMVYPFQLHLPLFRKRQVFVNLSPGDITELSGTVTSSISTTLSAHVPSPDDDAVPFGVPGVVVVDASGVEPGGVAVGRDKPTFVGGRVEVVKGTGISVEGCCAILTQADRVRLASRMNIQNFFMQRFYLAKMKRF